MKNVGSVSSSNWLDMSAFVLWRGGSHFRIDRFFSCLPSIRLVMGSRGSLKTALMWGNDYPHDEGTFLRSAKPIAAIRARLSDGDAHQVLCGNAARLYGFDLGHLAAHRDEVTSHLQ